MISCLSNDYIIQPLILLEELEIPYVINRIDLGKGEQHSTQYKAINPNSKIPAIVDTAPKEGSKPFALWESGAILTYLAEKYAADCGKSSLLPRSSALHYATYQWLYFQVGGAGPMFGQYSHFVNHAKEKVPYGIERYTAESNRLLQVIETQLKREKFIAGPDYTVADIALYPWVKTVIEEFAPKDDALHCSETELPHITAWLKSISSRPAVKRAYDSMK